MKFLKIRIEEENYDKFQNKCSSKNKNMSSVIKTFIGVYNKNENTALLNIEDDVLKEISILCKEKKIKFNDLMDFLIEKAIKNKDKINL